MNLSRRFFLGGVASFGAFGGCRFFADPTGSFASGKPALTFGVISDIHIRKLAATGEKAVESRANLEAWGNSITLRHTFEWFRDQGVDAVMIAGDMADTGMVEQLQVVGDVWYSVFPNDRAPDGRKVEKVFVYGNHDWEGSAYGKYAARKYPDVTERNRHILAKDFGGWWEKIFHEAYSPIYLKNVKGFTFIGQHWQNEGRGAKCHFARLGPLLAEKGKTIDPKLPFFYVQHPHPKNTCYGAWAWGRDAGNVTKALSAYSNAIAFSGHSHFTLTDERSIWQGAFTSVGTASLRYTGNPCDECMPSGYENTVHFYNRTANKAMLMPLIFMDDSRQGMLWRVFSDRIVVQKREFLSDTDLSDNWVLPLPAAESKPFAFAEHAKHFNAPQFPAGASLVVEGAKVHPRGAQNGQGDLDGVKITIPAAVVDKNARAYRFRVTAASAAGKKTKLVLAEGFNHPATSAKAKSVSWCAFSRAELPAGEVTFTVTPENCFRKAGTPLTATCPSPKA